MTEVNTDMLKQQLDNAESELRTAKNAKADLEKQLKRIDSKMRYSPNVESLSTERESIVESLADQDEEISSKQEAYDQAQRELHQAQVAQERERIAQKSTGYSFHVPDDDPVLGCQMLAAIADRLQYQFLSSQGYFEYLVGQVYGNRAGTDHEGIQSPEDAPNPEIARSDLDRLEQLREQREYTQALRFAVEEDFNAMAEKIPEDSEFRPRLLRRSDAQVLEDIERRREQRFERQREQREQAQRTARDFTRNIDLEVYKPGNAQAS